MSKRSSGRISLYNDVKEILDAALESGGGLVELATHGEAIHWRQRAYKFRKLYAETVDPYSPYDQLSFRDPGAGCVVEITVTRPPKFTPATNSEPVTRAVPIGDPLFDLAKSFANKLEND